MIQLIILDLVIQQIYILVMYLGILYIQQISVKQMTIYSLNINSITQSYIKLRFRLSSKTFYLSPNNFIKFTTAQQQKKKLKSIIRNVTKKF